MLNNWLTIIQDCLLPPSCILCDTRGLADKDICGECLNQLPYNVTCCYQCGSWMSEQHTQRMCNSCLKNPPPYQRTIAPFIYDGAMRYLITYLKFHQHYKNARLLGTLLAEHLPQQPLPECIIPVPLHKRRYQERGFNQSIEIARTVAKKLQIPLELDACIRQRNTPHQIGLNAKQRVANIRDAFLIPRRLPYQHVAILDDVMTQGATVSEIAYTLQKTGVSNIEVWVCARTQLD